VNKSWALLDARTMYLFESSAKIGLLLIPFADNFKEFIFNSYRDRATFWEIKGEINI
jgi:hypothetical protein